VTISDRRRVSADGITLYCISSYHIIAAFTHKTHVFIQPAERGRKEDRKEKGQEDKKEEDTDYKKDNHKKGKIYGCRHTPTPKADALPGVWEPIQWRKIMKIAIRERKSYESYKKLWEESRNNKKIKK
jgi:hypothetical protein